ncbi:hypothetical protein [Maricaulis virginensis]|nr:hypothetical protein [Maricaulis virginensis]
MTRAAMPGLSMSLLASQDGRIAHVRLFGDNGFEASAINAETISDYVASRRFGALIIDWSECSMLQTAPQFDAVAARFAARLSPTTRFIVLHRPDQFGHALFLTRALHRAGFPARAFQSEAECLLWLASQDTSPQQTG